ADFNNLKSNTPFPPLPYSAPPTPPEASLVYYDGYAASINIPALKTMKTQYPHIKVIISVGGWTLSWTFSKIAADSTLRATFVKSAVDFVISNGFDGVDIDWEFVGKQGIGYNIVDPINDGPNFVQLVSDMRAYMNTASPNKHLLITSAIGTNPVVLKNYNGAAPFLDYALLMTYDYSGPWANIGGHLSCLYYNPISGMDPQFNADSAVKNIEAVGFPTSKICVGCPMYGRGWTKITPTDPTQPLFGTATGGSATSLSPEDSEAGLSSWRDIVNVVGTNGYVRYYDSVAKAVYCYNTNTGETWSYEDPVSATDKANYVTNNNLAGMLFWELSDDTRNGSNNILSTVNSVFVNAGKQ
ncbi:MAG: chitinase, GH18 family, partial [Homavirus sp.]